jgi:hypothetical protein
MTLEINKSDENLIREVNTALLEYYKGSPLKDYLEKEDIVRSLALLIRYCENYNPQVLDNRRIDES